MQTMPTLLIAGLSVTPSVISDTLELDGPCNPGPCHNVTLGVDGAVGVALIELARLEILCQVRLGAEPALSLCEIQNSGSADRSFSTQHLRLHVGHNGNAGFFETVTPAYAEWLPRTCEAAAPNVMLSTVFTMDTRFAVNQMLKLLARTIRDIEDRCGVLCGARWPRGVAAETLGFLSTVEVGRIAGDVVPPGLEKRVQGRALEVSAKVDALNRALAAATTG